MSTVTVTLNANVAALPAGKSFNLLRVTLTDAGGPHQFDMNAAYISAHAVDQGNGSFAIPCSFSGVAPGTYTVKAQAYDVDGLPLGSEGSGTGTMPAGLGAGFMQTVTIGAVST